MMYCNAKLLQSGTNSSITSDILLPSILLKLLNKHSFSVNKICDLSFKVGDRGFSTATCVCVCVFVCCRGGDKSQKAVTFYAAILLNYIN